MFRAQRQQRWLQAMPLALVISVASSLSVASSSYAATPADRLLPQDTLASVIVRDVPEFKARWNQTGLGRLLADPAMEPFLSDVKASVSESLATFEQHVGMSMWDFLALPDGEMAIGLSIEQQKWSLIILVDVKENEEKVQGLLTLAEGKLEETGSKLSQEEIEGVTVHVVDSPAEDATPVQLAYFLRDQKLGVLLGSAGQMVQAVHDLFGRWAGDAENTLADDPEYGQILNQSAGDAGQQPLIQWYLDPISLITNASQLSGNAQAEVFLQFLPQLGFDKFKALGGSYDMATDSFDAISRIYLAVEHPLSGALKLFSSPAGNLQPESWVPSDVASYDTLSWDIKMAWQTIGELVEQFSPGSQPGTFSALVQGYMQNFGLEVDVQKDVIDPLGSRLTYVSDMKDPNVSQSGRMLFALSLSDADHFTQTLDKLLVNAGPQIQRREFQGHKIFEMEFPALGMFGQAGGVPGAGEEAEPPQASKIALTVAHDSLMLSVGEGLLEKVLGEQQERLADSLDYQLVAQSFPEQLNALSFSRPEVEYRSYYESLRSGTWANTLGMVQGGLPEMFNKIDGAKLPSFEDIVRYFAPAGGYWATDETGTRIISYTVKRESP